MTIGHYELVEMISAGPDGAAYRARAPSTSSTVELRKLTSDPSLARREELARRLALLDHISHPGIRPIEGSDLAEDPGWIALAPRGSQTLAHLLATGTVDAGNLVATVRAVADALAAAHRFGIAHGHLDASTIRLDADGLPTLDLTGMAVTPDAPAALRDADPADDVLELGRVLETVLDRDTGLPERTRPSDARASEAAELAARMQAGDPVERPRMAEVADVLEPHARPWLGTELDRGEEERDRTLVTGTTVSPASAPPRDDLVGTTLGRFELLECIGRGAMGAVYRGRDLGDGSIAAVKVLHPDAIAHEEALHRFRREGRILGKLESPYVARLLDANEDQGRCFLAVEFVEGRPLDEILTTSGALPEERVLGIGLDLARGLGHAHERGIIHRDVKPANAILVGRPEGETTGPGPRVKLCDFGIGRRDDAASPSLTRPGEILGTPWYMAPEQGTGDREVGPAADVYALGATLFHLRAGSPPFEGESAQKLLYKHAHADRPSLAKAAPGTSDATDDLVRRCLAKVPEDRPLDGRALAEEIENLLRGEPTRARAHPVLPEEEGTTTYELELDLAADPMDLWPHVSNTERINRAIGLPAMEVEHEEGEEGPRRTRVKARQVGLSLAWTEHPYEWVEGRRLGVLREFEKGPLSWYTSAVELTPRPEGGTRLRHEITVKPRSLLGRVAAAWEIGRRTRRALERVYRRIDRAIAGDEPGPTADPFEEPPDLSAPRRTRIETGLDELIDAGVDPEVVEGLGHLLLRAPAPEVARIRPIAFARRDGLPVDEVVRACLLGVRVGLLRLLWDLLCPVCRIPSEIHETLRAIEDHGRCEACGLDYELDFARSVEMVFRAHPDVREADPKTYCVGGPVHSPHVAAQVRLAPGETLDVDLRLEEGSFRIRSRQLATSWPVRVARGASSRRAEVTLAGEPASPSLSLRTGAQIIRLTNPNDVEVRCRVEREAPREDALTAARASTNETFRELFPEEVLAPERLVTLSTISLLVTDVANPGELYRRGDARAFEAIHTHFRVLRRTIRSSGGAVVKTEGHGLVASFDEAAAAVRCALELEETLAAEPAAEGLRLRAGVHRGAALATTLHDRLDYFGEMVARARTLPGRGAAGEVVLSEEVAVDPSVREILKGRRRTTSLADAPGGPILVLGGPETGSADEGGVSPDGVDESPSPPTLAPTPS